MLSAPHEYEKPQTLRCSDMRPRRVLVVDDYPDAAEAVCILLELLGHDTRMAHRGSTALDEAARYEPDIAIVDIGLPDMSGLDVARTLRDHANGRRLLLVAASGRGSQADRARAAEAGFDLFLLKPTDRVSLAEILRRAEEPPPSRT